MSGSSRSNPLEVRVAHKRFGDTVAVDGVDLRLGSEEIVSVVGPSGCGKSTLLRIIGGLERLDEGEIRLAGAVVDDGFQRVPPERRSVGLVFQDHALFPHLTVAANVAFGLRDLGRDESAARVDEMLDVVSLSGYGRRYPHERSGGERQRVALARALAPSPALMLFDEPFASLDRNLRDELRVQIIDALRSTGTAALMVTHDQHEALSMGDRIAVMRSGRLVQCDTPATIFHSPVDRFIAGFMGEASFLGVEDRSGTPSTVLGPLADDGRDGGLAMVRPDDLELSSVDRAAGSSQPGDVHGEIAAREYRGTHWLVTVRLAADVEVLVATSHLSEPKVGATALVRLSNGHRQVRVRDADVL